jgi:hypothetical protein
VILPFYLEMQFEADDRGRGIVILGELQLVLIDRIDSKDIAMRLVVLRRAGTTIAVVAEI